MTMGVSYTFRVYEILSEQQFRDYSTLVFLRALGVPLFHHWVYREDTLTKLSGV